MSGSWCPYCAVPSKKTCNKEDCLTCFNKSFANFKGLTPSGKKKVDCLKIATRRDFYKLHPILYFLT